MKELFAGLLLVCACSSLFAQTTRTLLTANKDYYFNCSTGSNSNTGTSASPFADPLKAYQVAQQTLDLAGQYVVTVHGQANCSNAAWTFVGPLVGAAGPASFVIEGILGSPGAIQINGAASGYAFQVQFDAAITVRDLACNPGSGGGCMLGNTGVLSFLNVWFTTNSGNSLVDVAGPRSLIISSGANLISSGGGNVNIAIVAEDHGQVNLGGSWTMNGYPQWTTAFVQVDIAGLIDATGFSTSGPGTGHRASAGQNGIVFTNGTGQSLFPGTSDGPVGEGGLIK